MAGTRTVIVSTGKPIDTGEGCPVCRFVSIVAVLIFVDSVPQFFVWFCGRCKKRVPDA